MRLLLPNMLASSSIIYIIVLCFCLVEERVVQGLISLPKNESFPALIVFGDSIVDPGNNNYISTIAKCNFPPYGKDFMGGKPTGRFSNGKIPSDMIAEELGIKELVPPYLDPSLKPVDLLTGVCFASGASGYDPLTSKIASARNASSYSTDQRPPSPSLLQSVLSLSDQSNLFKEYIGKLKAIGGEERSKRIISDSLYIVVAGSDDIANTYYTTPFRRLKYDIPSYTDIMLKGASTFLQELYGLGARRIGVFSSPLIGCVPSQRTLGGGLKRECAEKYNRAELLFNSKLSNEVVRLNDKFLDSRIVYIDIYNPLLDVIRNPSRYGFEVVTDGCCGTGKIEVSILCTDINPYTCADDSKYVFWDSYHPTQRAYEVLVGPLLSNYISRFF